METKTSTNLIKTICILSIKHNLNTNDYIKIISYFNNVKITLIASRFDTTNLLKKYFPILWVDGYRLGFLNILIIVRRISWSNFDLIINWGGSYLENIICFILLPKPRIISRKLFLNKIRL